MSRRSSRLQEMEAELQREWQQAMRHSGSGAPTDRRMPSVQPTQPRQSPIDGDGEAPGSTRPRDPFRSRRSAYRRTGSAPHQSIEAWERQNQQAFQKLDGKVSPSPYPGSSRQSMPIASAPPRPEGQLYGALAGRLYGKPASKTVTRVYEPPEDTTATDFILPRSQSVSTLTLQHPHTLRAADSPVSPDSAAAIVLEKSQESLLYCLRRHGTNTLAGTPLIGTGQQLTFVTPLINQDTYFNLLAIDIQSGTSRQLPDIVQVTVQSEEEIPTARDLYPINATVAPGEQTLIAIKKAGENVRYTLYDATTGTPVPEADETQAFIDTLKQEETTIGDESTIGTGRLQWQPRSDYHYLKTPTLQQDTDFMIKLTYEDGTEMMSGTVSVKVNLR